MGAARVELVEGPLDAQALRAGPAPGAGGALEFLGVVRPTEQDRAIRGLRYEVYQPMALRVLQELGDQAIKRFGLIRLATAHSQGFVPAGAASFWLAVEAPHRREALEATAWFIDAMKRDAPIWKTPVFADGAAVEQRPAPRASEEAAR